MRIIIIVLLIVIQAPIFAQKEYSDHTHKEFKKLLDSIDSQVGKIRVLEDEIKSLKDNIYLKDREITNLRKSNLKNSNDLERAINDYNDKSEFVKSLQSQLNNALSKLHEAEDDLQAYYEENKELVENNELLIKRYEEAKESSDMYFRLMQSTIRDADLFAFDLSYIIGYKVGIIKINGKHSFVEVYDGEKVTARNPRLLDDYFDVVRINNGRLIIKKESGFFDKNISGVILVYVDNKLVHAKAKDLKYDIHRQYENYASYDFSEISITLNKKIRNDSQVRVGYVDKATYNQYKEYFQSFWEADNRNLFLLTTIEPDHINFIASPYLEKDVIRKDYLRSFSQEVEVIVSDYQVYDNDIVNIYHNDKIIFSNFMLPEKSKPFKFELTLDKGENFLYVEALDEGSEKGGCTILIDVNIDGELKKTINLKNSIGQDTYEALLITY